MIDPKKPQLTQNFKTHTTSNKLYHGKKSISKTSKKVFDTSPKFNNLNIQKMHAYTNPAMNKKSYYMPLMGGRNSNNKSVLTGGTYKSSLSNLKKMEFSQKTVNHQKNITTTFNQNNKTILNYNNKNETQSQKLLPEKDLLKQKIKLNNTLVNERNSNISQSNTIGANNINKEKTQLNFSDEEEDENSLHTFIPPSPEHTEDTNDKNQTTQINIDNNIFGIYLTIPDYLKKNSKETLNTEAEDAEILEKKLKQQPKLCSMDMSYNKMKKRGLKSLNVTKIKNKPIANLKIAVDKKNIDHKINVSVKNTNAMSALNNFHPTVRTNKFLLSDKKFNNSIRSFSGCNSKYNLSKRNPNNSYYYYLKSIARPPSNQDINKNNSVGHFHRNDTKDKMNSVKVENKQKIKIKIKKNSVRKNNISIHKSNKQEKNLYNNNNSNKLLKLLSNLDNKKVLSSTITNINSVANNNQKADNNKNENNTPDNNKSTTLNNTLLVKKLYKNLKNNSKQKFENVSINIPKTIIPKKHTKSSFIKNKNSKNANSLNIITEIKQKETISEKDLEKPQLPLSSNRNNINFFPREYPNMAPTKTKIEKEDLIFLKQKKTIKNINFLCKRGYSGPGIKKLNQDNYFIYKNFLENENYIYMGICDGHGIFGQNISDYLVEHLPKKLNKTLKENNLYNINTENIYTLSQIFEKVFLETNNEMNNDERIDSSLSGSTCVSLIFTNERVICINVGDSRCILGKFNKTEFSYLNLSRDHKPDDPDEKERIIKKNGIVEAFRDVEGNFIGPKRVWCKDGDTPGLAMSRSFGDEIAHDVGVICNPEIFDYHLLKEDMFIILASDGIWEFISSEEVVDIVKEFYWKNDVKGAAECLYEEACKRWMNKEGIIDDITLIIAFFE